MSNQVGYTVTVQNRFLDLNSDSESDEPQIKKEVAAVAAAPKPQAPRATQFRASPQRVAEEWSTGRVQKSASGEEETNENGAEKRYVNRRRNVNSKDGKPEFKPRNGMDRRSGTGRGKEMKKSGGGGHNWGNTEADFGGNQSPVKSGSASFEGNTAEGGSSTPTSAEEPRQTPPAPVEEVIVNFAQYQQDLKKKRAQLQQAQEEQFHGQEIRTVDESVLSGFEKYQREETAEERAARELQMQRTDERDEEPLDTRTKKFNICEFAGNMSRRPGRNPRDRRNHDSQEKEKKEQPQPKVQINLNLQDAADFPTLGLSA